METLLTAEETALYLNVSARTLAKWRKDGIKLRYLKIGPKVIRYRPEDVEKFIEGQICLK